MFKYQFLFILNIFERNLPKLHFFFQRKVWNQPMLNKRYISTDGKVFKPLSLVVRIVTLEPGWKLFYIVNILKKKPEPSKSQSCKQIKFMICFPKISLLKSFLFNKYNKIEHCNLFVWTFIESLEASKIIVSFIKCHSRKLTE